MVPRPLHRCAAAGVYRAVGKVGGAGLWTHVGYAFEDVARTCVDGLYQPDRAVQDAYAVALGEIAAACTSSAADEALKVSCCVAAYVTPAPSLTNSCPELCDTRLSSNRLLGSAHDMAQVDRAPSIVQLSACRCWR